MRLITRFHELSAVTTTCMVLICATVLGGTTAAADMDSVRTAAVDTPRLLAFLDRTLAEQIETQETIDKINRQLTSTDEKMSCRSIVYGKARVVPILDDNSRVVPSVTFFVMTWIYRDDDREGPDFENSIHLLTAVSLFSANGKLELRASTADVRRRMNNEWAANILNDIIDTAGFGRFNFRENVIRAVQTGADDLANELGSQVGHAPEEIQRGLASIISGLPVHADDFSRTGGQPVRQVRFVGCETRDEAVLVATLFTADMATYHVVRGCYGFALRDGWKFTTPDGRSQWGDANNVEDERAPGRHFVTVYLGPNAKIPHLGSRGEDSSSGLGYGWSDRAAAMWLQPGSAYDGERLRLHADQATDNSIYRDFEPGFHCLSFYTWIGDDSRVHEKASGLSVRR